MAVKKKVKNRKQMWCDMCGCYHILIIATLMILGLVGCAKDDVNIDVTGLNPIPHHPMR